MINYSVFSESGDRKINEDYVGVAEKDDKQCFIVCDGLGGHGMGDVASQFVTDIFIEQFNACNASDTYLSGAFIVAQERLQMYQKENRVKNKMCTTIAALLIDDSNVYVGHIGDSRVYVFSKEGIKRRTIDHSVPQMLALSGEIEEKDIRKHPDRNRILRAMGIEWERPMYELLPVFELSECVAFLLCSDGFWEYIEEDEMISSLRVSKTAEEWLAAMKTIVKKNGRNQRMDNFSAIAVLNLENEK